jgi:hypothetical protein
MSSGSQPTARAVVTDGSPTLARASRDVRRHLTNETEQSP